jgi:hypothetical protein
MGAKRKIKCDCGGLLEDRIASIDNIETDAMVCNKCKFTTLTKEQAKKYAELKHLHHAIDSERKIIQIGNSIGITLPEGMQGMGVKVGKKVKIGVMDEKSFRLEIIS